jgi:general L-amino acid transport system permease protein
MAARTDTMERHTSPPPSEAPPVTEVGVLGWIKENLFGSWGNAVLTVIAVYFIYIVVRLLIRFIFVQADWTVVASNLALYAIGQYPRDQAWRTAAALGVVVALGTAHALLWKRFVVARRILSVLWLLSFPAIWVILAGFEGSAVLPAVRTQLWSGLLLTIMLTVVGIVVSFPLGVLLALGRRGDLIIIKVLCTIYIEAIRGVPLISILFMSQVMLPLFLGNANIDVVLRAMAGVTLFSAAYLAENVRGGLQAIPRGQFEAAEALGLSAPLVTALIVLPQALRIVIPAIVGQFISLFKDTTLVSIITLLDLLGVAAAALAQDPEFQFHKMEVYLFLAAIYFVLSYAMSSAARRIEAATGEMGGTHQL